MNSKHCFAKLSLCSLLLWLIQVVPVYASDPVPPPEPPDGPYAISINVFLDPYYLPKMENVKLALKDCAISLKKHLNLEITWYIHGRVFGIEKWHPTQDLELKAAIKNKVKTLVKADANIVFTNRNWVERFCVPGFGRISCDTDSVHGYYCGGVSTIIIYHTDKCVGDNEETKWIECNSNSKVVEHEIGHLLRLDHDANKLSIMYPNYNPDGGFWLESNIKEAKAGLCHRGYLKCQ